MEGDLKGQIIVDKFISNFNFLWTIKVLFPNSASYDMYTELDMAARNMISFSLSHWQLMEKYHQIC